MKQGKCSTRGCRLRGLKQEFISKVGKCEECKRTLKPIGSTRPRFGAERQPRSFGK